MLTLINTIITCHQIQSASSSSPPWTRWTQCLFLALKAKLVIPSFLWALLCFFPILSYTLVLVSVSLCVHSERCSYFHWYCHISRIMSKVPPHSIWSSPTQVIDHVCSAMSQNLVSTICFSQYKTLLLWYEQCPAAHTQLLFIVL